MLEFGCPFASYSMELPSRPLVVNVSSSFAFLTAQEFVVTPPSIARLSLSLASEQATLDVAFLHGAGRLTSLAPPSSTLVCTFSIDHDQVPDPFHHQERRSCAPPDANYQLFFFFDVSCSPSR